MTHKPNARFDRLLDEHAADPRALDQLDTETRMAVALYAATRPQPNTTTATTPAAGQPAEQPTGPTPVEQVTGGHTTSGAHPGTDTADTFRQAVADALHRNSRW